MAGTGGNPLFPNGGEYWVICMLELGTYNICLKLIPLIRWWNRYHSVFQLGVGKRAGCKRNWAQSSTRATKIRAQFSAQTTKNRAQFRARTPTIWAQSSARTKQDRGTILWAIDENMGPNLQTLYSSTSVRKHKLYVKKKIVFQFRQGAM